MSFPEGCLSHRPQSGRLDFKAPGCEIKRNVSSRVYVWDLMRRTGAQTTKNEEKNKNHISLIEVIQNLQQSQKCRFILI
jgi:hypothetical protein